MPRRPSILLASLSFAALLLMLTAAAAERPEIIHLASVYRGQPTKITLELLRPESAGGKLPAMIIVHGSGGVSAKREQAYAREFLNLGVAAAIIDSFGGRGVGTTVLDQDQVSAYDMLVDAAKALLSLRRHAAIDPERIGIIGFSKGGTVATKAALRRYIGQLTGNEAKFSVAIALYPWCGDFPLDMRATETAIHLLLGADDTYTGTSSCDEYGKRVQELGGNIQVKTYKAKHGWDVPGPAAWSNRQGQNRSRCVYDEIEKGKWIERGSRIVVMESNKPTGNSAKALAQCMTLGVSGGYDREVHVQSLQDIRDIIRGTFQLK